MDKLKVDLFRYGTLVVGKVLHTPKKLKNRGEPEIVLGKLDSYKVATCRSPALVGLCLYVHGSSTYWDDRTIYYDYGNETAADKAIVMFKSIIDEINKKLEKEEEEWWIS